MTGDLFVKERLPGGGFSDKLVPAFPGNKTSEEKLRDELERERERSKALEKQVAQTNVDLATLMEFVLSGGM